MTKGFGLQSFPEPFEQTKHLLMVTLSLVFMNIIIFRMNEYYLILKQKENANVVIGDLLLDIIQNKKVDFKDYDVATVNDLNHFIYAKRLEIAEFILEKGVSHLLSVQALNESIVKAGASVNQVIIMMHKYLEKIDIGEELILIDPYFLATNDHADYPQLIVEILKPFLTELKTLRLFTNSKVNESVKNDVQSALKAEKPDLNIIHKKTNHFHDRFWIAENKEKGIITGTSLNGLGRRFSLIDRLNKSDVREIVTELEQLNFLN